MDTVFVAVFTWMAFIAFVAMVFVASALSPRLPPEAMRIPLHLCLEPLHIDLAIRLHDVARGARLTARIVVASVLPRVVPFVFLFLSFFQWLRYPALIATVGFGFAFLGSDSFVLTNAPCVLPHLFFFKPLQ